MQTDARAGVVWGEGRYKAGSAFAGMVCEEPPRPPFHLLLSLEDGRRATI